jgi:phage host-nuclease inhibitor protein Gam
MLAKFKALEAKREYEERAGLLISRADAERDHLRIVLAARAALLALPDQIAAQVANLDARAAAAALRERVEWICQQHQDGMVAVPKELEAALEQLVDFGTW